MGFFDAFTGKSQQRDLQRANATANAALDSGYQQSQQRYDQAFDMFSPYAQQGQQGQKAYLDLLGLNGQEAQGSAYGMMTSNPIFQGQLGQESNAMLRAMNARGQGAGGAAAMAGQRVFQQNAGNWLDRYAGLGQQGMQATGQQAGIRTAQGDNAFGYGATKAGNAINFGNAMASSRGIGVNNLLNVLGTGAKVATAAYGTGGFMR